MVRNVDDVIESLPASRQRRIEERAAALVAEEKLVLQEMRQQTGASEAALDRS
jgi:hypothetical protein